MGRLGLGMEPGAQAKGFGSGPGLSVTLQANRSPHLRASQVRAPPPAPGPAQLPALQVGGEAGAPGAPASWW